MQIVFTNQGFLDGLGPSFVDFLLPALLRPRPLNGLLGFAGLGGSSGGGGLCGAALGETSHSDD